MTTNDFEIFFVTAITGTAGLGFFIYLSHILVGFLRQTVPSQGLQQNKKSNGPATPTERRGATTVPTIICSLPIPTQARNEQRLW
jgi:hypothetical protein